MSRDCEEDILPVLTFAVVFALFELPECIGCVLEPELNGLALAVFDKLALGLSKCLNLLANLSANSLTLDLISAKLSKSSFSAMVSTLTCGLTCALMSALSDEGAIKLQGP